MTELSNIMLRLTNYFNQKKKVSVENFWGFQELAISNLPTLLFAKSSKYFEVERS